METPMKFVCVLILAITISIAQFNIVQADGKYYGPCGKHNIEKEAEKLAPCTKAAKNLYVPVSEKCCNIMEKKLQNPSCLCAILFTKTLKDSGINPAIAVTIPKRCNIHTRPIGHKCGAFPMV